MNRAEEDYIKTIYELTVEKKQVLIKSNEIAEQFGYTVQSVNEMIKKLEKKHMVSFVPYKGISITKKGKEAAIRMIRAHRIWEVFLTEKLGFSWEKVHEDAEMLEHATSSAVLEKLYHFLGEPKYCQHGNPIPNQAGHIEIKNQMMLAQCQKGDIFLIERVMDTKPLLDFLDQHHLSLNDQIKLIDIDAFNEMIQIKNETQNIWMNIQTAQMIFGKVIKR